MRKGSLVLLLCAACTASDVDATSDARGFEADAMPRGARLWIEADDRQLSLWAAELGLVLGIATHVVLDTSHLAPQSASARQALGADALAIFEEVAPGDFTLGLARRGSEAGEVSVDAPTELAVIAFDTTEAGSVRLGPSRVMVRRADGSYVPTAAAGGTLHIAEGSLP